MNMGLKAYNTSACGGSSCRRAVFTKASVVTGYLSHIVLLSIGTEPISNYLRYSSSSKSVASPIYRAFGFSFFKVAFTHVIQTRSKLLYLSTL
ncbi:hypothetical protein C8J55DRAFT_500524 [Lentinula edodes]|uniref:Uncharacterized protein n=1 Tax=Lentinula lateritia TaxID=40482 RepID=A0A9W9AZD8_9AGAR|nr:hypothetical protein C8J55DRAFT_500524 [Lentinula edodes]